MPSLAVHMAIAIEYYKKNKNQISDFDEFMDGVKEPDYIGLLGSREKERAHYSDPKPKNITVKERFIRKVNLFKYLSKNKINSDFEIGYYLHLVTDYYFFSCFIYKPEYEEQKIGFRNLYSDYAKIAKDMENKYGVNNDDTPWKGMYKQGDPTFFSREGLYKFIDRCSDLDLEKLRELVLSSKTGWRELANNFFK